MNKKFLFLLFILFLSLNVFALTTSDANYSGGIYNGGFELGDANQTGIGRIGDLNNGWYLDGTSATGLFADFNSTFSYSGNQSMYYSVDRITSSGIISVSPTPYPGSTLSLSSLAYAPKVKPSTTYKLSGWIYIIDKNDLVTGYLAYSRYTASGTRTVASGIGAVTDVGVWVYTSGLFTTGANDNYAVIGCRAGNQGGTNGYFKGHCDDVRLEEVGSTSLVSQVSGRPSIVVTGVSDFDAIDQADTNNGLTMKVGSSEASKTAQQVTLTQNQFSGVSFRRGGSTGVYTGDMTISIHDNNTIDSTPKTTALYSVLIPNAQWEAIPVNTDYSVYTPLVLDANGTNTFWIVFSSSTINDSNYARVYGSTTNSYSGGVRKDFNSLTNSWTTVRSTDASFKTLFRKDSSAFDLNVCSSGDSVCESKTYNIDDLDDGETYTITPSNAPLFYQGDNNVYFMMHSDSDYNNKTPSMMTNLLYNFDKPTTTLTNNKGNDPSTRSITLTCTNGTTGNCNQTFYKLNGNNWTQYIYPFNINTQGQNLILYYSTDDNNNIESTNTTTITVSTQPSTGACGLITLVQIVIAAVLLIAIGLAVTLGGGNISTQIVIGLIITAISTVIAVIIFASVTMPFCGI